MQGKSHIHMQGRWAFSDEVWARVSDEAKALVRSLLRRNPSRRPSAAALLQHPWVIFPTHILSLQCLVQRPVFLNIEEKCIV